jgi:hypothetical protein
MPRSGAASMIQTSLVTSKPKHAQGTSACTSHMGGLRRCSVVPVGRRRTGGERWTPEHAEWPRSRVAEEKSSPKLVTCAHWPDELFSGPRQWTGRVLALRPGSGDRPVRVWVQGPRRGARSARSIHHSPTLLSSCRWKAGAWWARRAVLRRARECGRPVRPGTSAARTARLRAARRRRLKDVEKLLTGYVGKSDRPSWARIAAGPARKASRSRVA